MKIDSAVDYKAIGKRIRRLRKEAQKTQAHLAEEAGISLSFLGHIERGSRVLSVETLLGIANALNVSTDSLLRDSLDIQRGFVVDQSGLDSMLIADIRAVLLLHEGKVR